MKTIIFALTGLCLALPACAGSPAAEPSSPATASQTASPSEQAQAPEKVKARTHLEQHVQYPADRSKILAACAQTKEFTDAEKRWFEQNLPEGKYQSAAEVISALKL